MALEPTKHVNGRMWQPGQSGNPNGRPVGSRTAFSAAFCKDLAEVWSKEGREAMVKTAKTNPAVFFATCARLIGPEVKLTIEQQQQGNLSPAEWNLMLEIVDAVRQAIPDASNRAPGAVPEHVLGALRMADAKCVENAHSIQSSLLSSKNRWPRTSRRCRRLREIKKKMSSRPLARRSPTSRANHRSPRGTHRLRSRRRF